MTLDAIERMEMGQLVDYVIEYNNKHDPDMQEKQKARSTRRKAQQGDWDAFLG